LFLPCIKFHHSNTEQVLYSISSMIGSIIAVGTLVALAQGKAIITNRCPQPVYVWSIPSAGSAHTNNLPIPPGGRYEEAWRHGTSEQPGIALKISTEVDGIYKGMDEINFAYSIERSNKSEVWVDLSPVRGKPFDSRAFHSCHGMHQSSHVQPGKCKATDDIELVLCDDTPLKHITTTYQASSKYNYQATTTITITEHATVTELAREEPPACRETANTLRKHTMAGDQEPGLFDLLDEILGFDDDVMMKCVRKNCSPNWPSDVETL
jgi:hypothetical protein